MFTVRRAPVEGPPSVAFGIRSARSMKATMFHGDRGGLAVAKRRVRQEPRRAHRPRRWGTSHSVPLRCQTVGADIDEAVDVVRASRAAGLTGGPSVGTGPRNVCGRRARRHRSASSAPKVAVVGDCAPRRERGANEAARRRGSWRRPPRETATITAVFGHGSSSWRNETLGEVEITPGRFTMQPLHDGVGRYLGSLPLRRHGKRCTCGSVARGRARPPEDANTKGTAGRWLRTRQLQCMQGDIMNIIFKTSPGPTAVFRVRSRIVAIAGTCRRFPPPRATTLVAVCQSSPNGMVPQGEGLRRRSTAWLDMADPPEEHGAGRQAGASGTSSTRCSGTSFTRRGAAAGRPAGQRGRFEDWPTRAPASGFQ